MRPISTGCTSLIMSRASMTNGLKGGMNDTRLVHAPTPPLSATTAIR